jgi:hypothetical protein
MKRALPWHSYVHVIAVVATAWQCNNVWHVDASESQSNHQQKSNAMGSMNSNVTCNYGTAPGSWVSTNVEGSRWQLLGSRCQLQPLLQQYRRDAGTPPPPLRILALSDSVDNYIMMFTCANIKGKYSSLTAANATGRGVSPQHYNTPFERMHTCLNARLKLASVYFPGVHPTGPYHSHLTRPATARIDFAKEHWEGYAGGPPDVVIVAANLWDIARMYGRERALLRGNELSLETIHLWMANFTAVVQHAKKAFPEVRCMLQGCCVARNILKSSAITSAKGALLNSLFLRDSSKSDWHAFYMH